MEEGIAILETTTTVALDETTFEVEIEPTAETAMDMDIETQMENAREELETEEIVAVDKKGREDEDEGISKPEQSK